MAGSSIETRGTNGSLWSPHFPSHSQPSQFTLLDFGSSLDFKAWSSSGGEAGEWGWKDRGTRFFETFVSGFLFETRENLIYSEKRRSRHDLNLRLGFWTWMIGGLLLPRGMLLGNFHIFREGLKPPTSIDTALKTFRWQYPKRKASRPEPMNHHQSLNLRCFPYSIPLYQEMSSSHRQLCQCLVTLKSAQQSARAPGPWRIPLATPGIGGRRHGFVSCMDRMRLGCTVDFNDRQETGALQSRKPQQEVKHPLIIFDISFSGKRHQGSKSFAISQYIHTFFVQKRYVSSYYTEYWRKIHMMVSWNRGTPKSSSLKKWVFLLSTNHLGIPPFMETPHICIKIPSFWGDGRWLARAARDAQQIPLAWYP